MGPERKLSWKWIIVGIVAAIVLFIAITQTTARRDAVRMFLIQPPVRTSQNFFFAHWAETRRGH